MRGKDNHRQKASRQDGITPAYAGKSITSAMLFLSCLGSPPRMRGKGCASSCTPTMTGITPAYAGKSSVRELLLIVSRDHPRVCGEKPVAMHSCTMTRGSPPRMRGKAHLSDTCSTVGGITPAYAGKRKSKAYGTYHPQDHPRVCGEKPIPQIFVIQSTGSPPRMRGKVRKCRPSPAPRGITPAYAGKSGWPSFGPPPHQDHPRVCGEKCVCFWSLPLMLGSPPRMRGKALSGLLITGQGGITPAYAGKRRAPQGGGAQPWDHPRVCGEKGVVCADVMTPEGSPPRMRGKVAGDRVGVDVTGITPAYAGKRP